MLKRALLAVLGVLGLCLPIAAQVNPVGSDEYQSIALEDLQKTGAVDIPAALALYQPDSFSQSGNGVLIYGFPALTLLDGHRFLISGPLGRLAPGDLFPVVFVSGVNVQKINSSPMYGVDSPGGVLDVRLNRTFSGGEFGVFYGKSDGKFGYEEKQAHIIGSVGNDKFQITAGAVYEEASGHIPSRNH